MDIFNFNMTSMLSLNFEKDSEKMFITGSVLSFQVNLVKPIMISLFQSPHLGDLGVVELCWDLVLDQVLCFVEMLLNLVVNLNNFVSHFNIMNVSVKSDLNCKKLK